MTKKIGFAVVAALSLTLAACGGGETNAVEADANVVANEVLPEEGLGNDLSLDNGVSVDALANSSGNVAE